MPLDQKPAANGQKGPAAAHVTRVAICGEVSAGKSTVLNVLIGEGIVPDNLGTDIRPVISVGWRKAPGIEVTLPDGQTKELPWPGSLNALRGAAQIRIWTDKPHLQHLELVEVPITTAEELGDAQKAVVQSSDVLVWVTIASQAWRLTEKKILDELADARPARCVIAISRGDKLRNEADRSKLLQRVERETAAYFSDAVFVHGARDLLDGARQSAPDWARTGGPGLLDKIAPGWAPPATQPPDAETPCGAETATPPGERAKAIAQSDLEAHEALSSYYGPTNFVWLERGRLGGTPRPGLSQSVELDAAALKRLGISMVVTLTEEWEPPAELFAAHDLDSLFVPIPDMQPPTDAQAMQTCETVARVLNAGGSVVFHCHAGHGRTGTMLAAMLIWTTPDAAAAIARVKSANKNWIQTEAQMNFLDRFARLRRKMLGPTSLEIGQDREAPTLAQTRSEDRQKAVSDQNQLAENTSLHPPANEGNTMSLDKAVQQAMGTIPECLASGYVDMDSGMLLGIHTVDSHPQEVLDMLAAATADLFQGPAITQIEDAFKTARGTKDDAHYFQEILVFSENLLHVFMRTKAYPDHVCAFVCRKSANPGMALTKARMSLDGITASF